METRGRPDRRTYLWLGGLLAIVVVVVLGTIGSGDTAAPTEPQPGDAVRTAEGPSAPTLVGAPRPERADTSRPPAREPAPESEAAPTPPDAEAWSIEFEVEGAPRWWRATFRPRADHGKPEFAWNPEDGPPFGRLEVRGNGQLVVYARGRVPWISEMLDRPPSGTMQVTARLEEGLSIAGVLLASDGSTPVNRGQVRVKSALGPDGAPERELGRSWVQPDVHGYFRLTGLSPGPVVLLGFAYDRTLGDRTQVEVEAGDQRVVLQLRPIGILNLVLSDAATGKAPRTSSIQIDYTSASGGRAMAHMARNPDLEPGPPIRQTLDGLRVGTPGTLRVRANGYEFYTTEFEFPPEGGVQDIAIPLQPGEGGMALLILTLVAENGQVPELVSVMRRTGEFGVGAPETVVEGRLELRLAPGTTSLVIGPAGSDSFHVPVEIELDEASTSPGARVEREVRLVHGGQLCFSERPPASRIRLSRGSEVLERDIALRHDVDSMLVLPPGRWSFRIEGHVTWVGEADIVAGEVTHATWRVERTKK